MDHGFQLMYMNLHRAEFNTFNVISSRNVCLDGDSIAKAIKMGSIVVGLKMKDKTTRICFTMRCTCSNCKPTYWEKLFCERWAVSFLEYWNFVWWNMPYDRGVELTFEIFIDKFIDKKNL